MDPPRHKPAGGYHGHNLSDTDAFLDAQYHIHTDWPDLKSCAASLDVTPYVLEEWYNGKFRNRPFTDLLRKKIIEWGEKNKPKKQETVVALPVDSNGAAAKPMMGPPPQNPAGGHPSIPSRNVLFEDTKQCLYRMWPDENTCLQELDVSKDDLKTWYKGGGKDQKFTAVLRSKIKVIEEARAKQAGAPAATKPAGAPVAATGVVVPVATKPAGAPAAMKPAGAPVAPKQQCPACRGKHEKHTCGKQKDPVQLLTSVVRPLQSGVANSGLQPRPPAVQAPTVVPAVVRRPRPTLGKRVADLEQTVEKLTAELQFMRKQLDTNVSLTNLVATSILANGAQASPLNDQHAHGEPSQEDPSSSKKARRS